MQQKVKEVYWEQQGIDQLCGLHTLNSLLQGPFFNEIQMAELALSLDQQEKSLMGYTGKSQNVSDDGNYSIQVLQQCLSQVNLRAESIDSKINRNDDLVKETGFICNSQSHWFAIRKAHGKWYNLNSCSVYGPQTISEFYLSAFLQNVRQGGYTIFVVKGKYPPSNKSQWPHLQKYQRFLTEEIISRYEEMEKQNNQGGSLNIGAYDASNMDKAIDESKKLADLVKNQEMPELSNEVKTQQFQGQGISLQNNSDSEVNYVNFQNNGVNMQEDPELAFVMKQSLKASLEEKFSQKNTEGVTIRFMHPSGEKSMWTFSENNFIEDLYDYAFYKTPDNENYKFYLSQTHPTKKFTNLKQTLVEADIEDMTTIFITKL